MKRFVSGVDREQSTLLPECLDDFIDEGNPVRAIDAFVDTTDLAELGFDGVGLSHSVQSSRRLEREAGRNVELMWLLERRDSAKRHYWRRQD